MRDDVLVLSTKTSPAEKMKFVPPRFELNFKKCETRINIGFFFDGTNNNMERDIPSKSETNMQGCTVYITTIPRSVITVYTFLGLELVSRRLVKMEKATLGRGVHSVVRVESYLDC